MRKKKLNRNLEAYVKYYDFLTPEECETTVTQLEKINWQEHTFYQPHSGEFKSYDHELSVSHDDFAMKTTISQKIWHFIRKYVVEDHAHCSSWYSGWNGYTIPRFNKYSVDTQMKIHCDHIHSMFDGQRKGVPVLTILGALNDDYEGGELMMWNDTVIELKAGKVMIFPSNFLYPHEVKLVTKGTRYSFVSWVW